MMNALWWWIDRWRKSTAYTDMTLEEQGAYRNLLDEAWLRGGALPRDPRILAKASGDSQRWPRLRNVLMKRFFVGRDKCLHHETLDEIIQESARRAEKQRAYRARQTGGNGRGNKAGNKPGSPSPSLSTPYSPPRGTPKRRRRRPDVAGGSICQHQPRCRTTQACITRTLKDRR
jgi:uncharacterized protein YdaU (DUF1376 family)